MKGSIVARLGTAIAGVLLSVSAFGQGSGQMGGPGSGPGMEMHRPPIERAFGGTGIQGRWWNNPRIIENLKLTDDQRKAFDQILLDHREKLIDLRANVEKAELQLEPLVRDDQPNESAILAQIDKVAQARAELEKANARYLLALRGKLTPDQWKDVQQLRQNHENWRPGFHRQGQRGPGQRGPEDGNGPGAAPAPSAPGPQGAVEEGGALPQLRADEDTPGAGIF
jgi:Spy/CpxP family protein refolding chaperone